MFGSKRVTWKKSEKTIARYLRVFHTQDAKKEDRSRPRKDKVLVWSDSAHPSPIRSRIRHRGPG